jgi:hypothetical protein
MDELVDYAVKLTKRDEAGNLVRSGSRCVSRATPRHLREILGPRLIPYGGDICRRRQDPACTTTASRVTIRVKALNLYLDLL